MAMEQVLICDNTENNFKFKETWFGVCSRPVGSL